MSPTEITKNKSNKAKIIIILKKVKTKVSTYAGPTAKGGTYGP